MADPTNVKPVELRNAAKAFDELAEGDTVFNGLATFDPNAGKFDTAEWLEDLFADRRDAILQHVKYLRRACDEISAGLYTVADAFEELDRGNAEAVSKFDQFAKQAVKGMTDLPFEPVKGKGKTTYDTGDNAATGDQKSFKIDGDDVTVTGGVWAAPGSDEFRKITGVGPGDTTIDLLGAGGFEDLVLENLDTTPPAEVEHPPPPPVHTFDPNHEPTGPSDRRFFNNLDFEQYTIAGEPQRTSEGWTVYWHEGRPYYDKDGDGTPEDLPPEPIDHGGS